MFKVNIEELQKILAALTRNFTNIFLNKLRTKAQVRGSWPHWFLNIRGMRRTTAAAEGHCTSLVLPTRPHFAAHDIMVPPKFIVPHIHRNPP